jgi:hypothetical protein
MTTTWRVFAALVLALVAGSGCAAKIPASVRAYAAELPARADGQYAALDDVLRKQLVMNDALLQCRIDREDGENEAASAACRCSTSVSTTWTNDCQDWLGDHTPAQAADPQP